MASFSVPFVAANPDSWGPPGADADEGNPNAPPSSAKFLVLPYSPFGRSDRLGRAADFTNISRGDRSRFNRQGRYDKNDRNNNNNNKNERNNNNDGNDSEDESFQLVDTSKATTVKRFVPPAAKRRAHTARLRQVNARRQQQGGTASFTLSKQEGFGGRGMGGRGNMSARGGRGGRGGRGRGRGGRGYNNNRIDRQPSVAVQDNWVKVEEVDLGKVTKNLSGNVSDTKKSKKSAEAEIPKPEDVLWCGFLDQYNDVYDKVTARQPAPLKRMATKEFYPVTTTDDPVLEKLAVDGIGGAGDGNKRSIFVTDTILAHLMTCNRSVYPWDLVIQKTAGGLLFLDKRDNSQLDYLTVYETSYNAPQPSKDGEDGDNLNTPERLGLEATTINQNFSQQILKKAGRKEMDLPNPFFDEDDADGMEPASVAYRYRKFELDENTTLVCRTELHGIVKKSQYMTAFALNEYIPPPPSNGPPATQSQTWRDRIDSQRGSVLANELKNNAFKLAKWTAQSLLAGADQMKIGFCSRSNPKSAYEHVILATQFYRPKDFANQITLSENSMWAMIRIFVTMLHKQEEGKYVLMREPNKAVLSLYKVPQDTFEEEE